jgi:hypothetical protein
VSLAFGRVCTVIVDDVKIARLRVQFSVKKGLTIEPNTAEIKIFNLAETTRARLKRKGAKVVLSAGYETGNAAVIFTGDARNIDHVKESETLWVTKIKCGDGERAYQFAHFSNSFRAGTPIADVILACGNAVGLNLGNLADEIQKGNFRGGLTQFSHGYTGYGSAIKQLNDLLKSVGLTLSIQDGALQVLRGGAAAPGRAILLSPDSGLIGSPGYITPEDKSKPSLMKFKSLLQPQIRCGGVVEMRAKSIKGQFRLETVQHTGDTEGSEWYSVGEGKPL